MATPYGVVPTRMFDTRVSVPASITDTFDVYRLVTYARAPELGAGEGGRPGGAGAMATPIGTRPTFTVPTRVPVAVSKIYTAKLFEDRYARLLSRVKAKPPVSG